MQAAALRVLLQPFDEPRPLLEQRLVDELDRSVVGDEQPALDQRREHARDALVVVGVELAARHAPARRGPHRRRRRRAGAGSRRATFCSSSSSDRNAASA